MRSLLVCLVLFAASLAAYPGRAIAPAPRLAPGTMFTVQFPEMPPTFYALSQKKDVKAQMAVYLPTNYDPEQNHPLLIFLNGGDGGTAWNPGMARALSEQRDFVCATMPLFKAVDPKTPTPKLTGPGFIMNPADGHSMWPFFKTMLAKLEELVPNIDPVHRILGGFSNGAHATAGLLDGSGGEVARLFSAFIFVEGGNLLQRFDLLRGKAVLMVSSNARSRPGAQRFCDAARAAGARTTFILEDVGKHEFPVTAYPAVRAWLRGPSLEHYKVYLWTNALRSPAIDAGRRLSNG